jgi:hypothetical protein
MHLLKEADASMSERSEIKSSISFVLQNFSRFLEGHSHYLVFWGWAHIPTFLGCASYT